MRRFLRTLVTIIRMEQTAGSPWGLYPRPRSFFEKLEKWLTGLEADLGTSEGEAHDKLQALVDKMQALCRPRQTKYPNWDFTRQEVNELLEAARDAHSAFGGTAADTIPSDVDSPRPFEGEALLRAVEATAEMLNVSEHVETLLVRLRALLSDARMKPIMGSAIDTTLDQWLTDYVGSDNAGNGCVSVVDLSLVPTDVVHVITAVIARIVFESLQRYVKLTGVALPTVLVITAVPQTFK